MLEMMKQTDFPEKQVEIYTKLFKEFWLKCLLPGVQKCIRNIKKINKPARPVQEAGPIQHSYNKSSSLSGPEQSQAADWSSIFTQNEYHATKRTTPLFFELRTIFPSFHTANKGINQSRWLSTNVKSVSRFTTEI